jgi:glycerol-3-phosphate dehydrogenase
LVTVTGGKLTTFRRLAFDALKAAKPFFANPVDFDKKTPVFDVLPEECRLDRSGLPDEVCHRLLGRYGRGAIEMLETAAPCDLAAIPGTHTLWAELPYVAAHEHIRHLSDIMLRRVRIGLLTPEGGKAYLKRIRTLCEPVLPWDKKQWKKEITTYLRLWVQVHALPGWRDKAVAGKKGTILDKWIAAAKRLAGGLLGRRHD